MKVKFTIPFILIIVLLVGCQAITFEPPTIIAPANISATSTQSPAVALIASLTLTPQPTLRQSELISKGKLDCLLEDTFTKCVDNVLNIEFEYPTTWNEIEAVLRTGGYSGYAYDYYYGGKTIAETEPLVAGGRSKDFSEGRGGMSTDFAGYGDVGLQFKKKACDSIWNDSFPICQEVTAGVAWMIQFPNAKYICNSAPGFYTKPIFRIEVNLPNNPTVNGFVFEAPFLSEKLSIQVKNDLYPLLGLGPDMFPTKCSDADQKAFDAKLIAFVEMINMKTTDRETQRKLDELIHLATSIQFR